MSFPFHPIYKSEVSVPVETGDFRPIGSVCLITKPIIRHAFNALENHIDPVRDIDQHGFTNKSGVITLIMCLLVRFFTNPKAAFLLHLYDFSCAFNSLVFSIFYKKLGLYNVTSSAFNFFKTYASPPEKCIYAYRQFGIRILGRNYGCRPGLCRRTT